MTTDPLLINPSGFAFRAFLAIMCSPGSRSATHPETQRLKPRRRKHKVGLRRLHSRTVSEGRLRVVVAVTSVARPKNLHALFPFPRLHVPGVPSPHSAPSALSFSFRVSVFCRLVRRHSRGYPRNDDHQGLHVGCSFTALTLQRRISTIRAFDRRTGSLLSSQA